MKSRREAEEHDAERRAARLGLPYLNLLSVKVPTELKAMALVPERRARAARLVPIQLAKSDLVVAIFDPEDEKTKAVLKELEGRFSIRAVVVSISGLEHAWGFYKYITEEGEEISGSVGIQEEALKGIAESVKNLGDVARAVNALKGASITRILEAVLGGGVTLGVSDIHMEPAKGSGVLRMRADGLLHNVIDALDADVYRSLVTRVKLLSNLKLNVKEEPQDGRFTINFGGLGVEVRTSVIPSEYGETVVLRILDPRALKVNLEELGFREDDLLIVKDVIARPYGLILNTGPTGSGKTTTLYAFLRKVFKPEIKVITIEDPIEYHLEGISQTQVDRAAKYTFASGLRSILRQDPDVILVGEIRDEETAEIALNASLTGHLVFSTLHTNDAVGSVPRLFDLKARPQIVGPALSLVIAQRLVRLLCPECKRPVELEEEIKNKIADAIKKLPPRVNRGHYEKITVFEPVGCAECGETGFRGRTSIFELFLVDERMKELIYKDPTETALKEAARLGGMVTMIEDGVLKTIQGLTSFSEVERVAGRIWEQ